MTSSAHARGLLGWLWRSLGLWGSTLKLVFPLAAAAYGWYLLTLIGWGLVGIGLILVLRLGIPLVGALPIPDWLRWIESHRSQTGYVILAWMPLALVGLAQSLVLGGSLTRLGIAALDQLPERSASAHRQAGRRWGALLRLHIQSGLAIVLFGIILLLLGGALLALILSIAAGWTVASGNGPVDPDRVAASVFRVGLISAALIGIWVIAWPLLWVASRWFVADVIVVLDPDAPAALSSIESWELTQGSVAKILLALVITSLLTLPLQMGLVALPLGLDWGWEGGILELVVRWVSGLLGWILGGGLTLPLWHNLKAAIYLDLITRCQQQH